MMDEVDEVALIVERAAALDWAKRLWRSAPHEQRPGRRMQERRGYDTTIARLSAMVGRLRLWWCSRWWSPPNRTVPGYQVGPSPRVYWKTRNSCDR